MAVNAVAMPRTSEAERDNENLQALIKGTMEILNTRHNIKGKEGIAQLEDLLTTGQKKADLTRAMDASKADGDRPIKTGSAEVMPNTGATRQMSELAREGKNIDGMYKTKVQPYIDQISMLESGAKALAQGTATGDEVGQIIKARFVEGKGSRLLDSVISKMGGNASMFKSGTDKMNYITGQVKSGMTPEGRSALMDLYQINAGQLEKDLGASEHEFKTRARNMAPSLMANGQYDTVMKDYDSTPWHDRLKGIGDTIASVKSGSSSTPAPGQTVGSRVGSAVTGGIDKLASFFSPAQQAAPQAGQVPQPPRAAPPMGGTAMAGDVPQKQVAAPAPAPSLTPEDQQAIEWAKTNAGDPQAQQILKLHGVK